MAPHCQLTLRPNTCTLSSTVSLPMAAKRLSLDERGLATDLFLPSHKNRGTGAFDHVQNGWGYVGHSKMQYGGWTGRKLAASCLPTSTAAVWCSFLTAIMKLRALSTCALACPSACLAFSSPSLLTRIGNSQHLRCERARMFVYDTVCLLV